MALNEALGVLVKFSVGVFGFFLLIKTALAFAMNDDFDTVTERLWCVIDKTVRNPTGAFIRAKAYMKREMWTLAALYLQRALSLQPSTVDYYLALAECYARLGRYPASLHLLDQAAATTAGVTGHCRSARRDSGTSSARHVHLDGRRMTAEQSEPTLRARVQRALLMNALTDWRGGIVLAISILLAFFGPDLFPAFPWWGWLIGGGAAWGAIVFSIFKDEKVAAQVAADLLKQKYEPTAIKSSDMRDKLIKAFEYRAQIAAAIARTKGGVLRDHLEQSASEMDDWIGGLWEVARRVDTFEGNRTIQQDLQLGAGGDPQFRDAPEDRAQRRRAQADSRDAGVAPRAVADPAEFAKHHRARQIADGSNALVDGHGVFAIAADGREGHRQRQVSAPGGRHRRRGEEPARNRRGDG